MAFIDELINKGGIPYGMEVEQPKAHENIDKEIHKNSILANMDPRVWDFLENLVSGGAMGKLKSVGKAGKSMFASKDTASKFVPSTEKWYQGVQTKGGSDPFKNYLNSFFDTFKGKEF